MTFTSKDRQRSNPRRAGLERPALITVALISALAATPLHGQDVPTRELGTADLVYERDFTDLQSLRPLSTGGVVAVEGLGGEVLLLGPDGRSATTVGSRGQGPSEYMSPRHALPLGTSDFTLIVDPLQQRLLIADARGNLLAAEPWRLPMGMVPVARSGDEWMYWDELGIVRTDGRGQVIEGPAPILRVRPGMSTPDTVATVTVHDLADRWEASPVSRMFSPGAGGMARFALDRSPFGAQDQWRLMPDGRVAIARARPYRIDVVGPEGTIRGPQVPVPVIEVTRADRDAFISRVTAESRGQTAGFSTDDGTQVPVRQSEPDPDDFVFPDSKPPFPLGALHVTGTRILVQRHVPADSDRVVVDVFDGSGRQVEQLHLPAGRTLVGANDDALWMIRHDEFDLQILERYGF